jgi:hypothetical protein|tara:strand:- start:22896 stop:23162 length:267 start_codon:yes stop_codon:yes gene_type:complete
MPKFYMSVFLIKKLFILNMEKNIKLHIIKKNNIISNDFSKIEYTKNNTIFTYPRPELITFESIITQYVKYIALIILFIFIYLYFIKYT